MQASRQVPQIDSIIFVIFDLKCHVCVSKVLENHKQFYFKTGKNTLKKVISNQIKNTNFKMILNQIKAILIIFNRYRKERLDMMGLPGFKDAEMDTEKLQLGSGAVETFDCYVLHPRWLHFGHLVVFFLSALDQASSIFSFSS